MEGTCGSETILLLRQRDTANVRRMTSAKDEIHLPTGQIVPVMTHEDAANTEITADNSGGYPKYEAWSEKQIPSSVTKAGAYESGPFLLLRNCH